MLWRPLAEIAAPLTSSFLPVNVPYQGYQQLAKESPYLYSINTHSNLDRGTEYSDWTSWFLQSLQTNSKTDHEAAMLLILIIIIIIIRYWLHKSCGLCPTSFFFPLCYLIRSHVLTFMCTVVLVLVWLYISTRVRIKQLRRSLMDLPNKY
jgi:hypothetical protein